MGKGRGKVRVRGVRGCPQVCRRRNGQAARKARGRGPRKTYHVCMCKGNTTPSHPNQIKLNHPKWQQQNKKGVKCKGKTRQGNKASGYKNKRQR